jgi:hypothetical protein
MKVDGHQVPDRWRSLKYPTAHKTVRMPKIDVAQLRHAVAAVYS